MSDLFEQVTRQGTRFQLPQGELSVEQLWQLKPVKRGAVDVLVDYEIQLQKELAEFGTFTRRTSATTAKTATQKQIELKLAVVSYILDVRDKEAQEAKDLAAKKAFNDSIISRIAKKQEAKLDDLSIEELQAMLK
jgi:hypothetical protein